ncbi:MAG: hypothetical protein WDW38_008822 [Sanguina aurantia]
MSHLRRKHPAQILGSSSSTLRLQMQAAWKVAEKEALKRAMSCFGMGRWGAGEGHAPWKHSVEEVEAAGWAVAAEMKPHVSDPADVAFLTDLLQPVLSEKEQQRLVKAGVFGKCDFALMYGCYNHGYCCYDAVRHDPQNATIFPEIKGGASKAPAAREDEEEDDSAAATPAATAEGAEVATWWPSNETLTKRVVQLRALIQKVIDQLQPKPEPAAHASGPAPSSQTAVASAAAAAAAAAEASSPAKAKEAGAAVVRAKDLPGKEKGLAAVGGGRLLLPHTRSPLPRSTHLARCHSTARLDAVPQSSFSKKEAAALLRMFMAWGLPEGVHVPEPGQEAPALDWQPLQARVDPQLSKKSDEKLETVGRVGDGPRERDPPSRVRDPGSIACDTDHDPGSIAHDTDDARIHLERDSRP